ncbi:MAG: adenine phosphoribosyltransferase [Gammaproteobacteria bacterium]
MSKQQIKDLIHAVPDFPKLGVSFKDISPLLKNGLSLAIDEYEKLFTPAEWEKVDYLAGIESRGFVFAAALAERLGKGLVLIRKQGKLPGDVQTLSYSLEYGEAVIEMQRGAGSLVIIDDVLATGGTLQASADLAVKSGYSVFGIAVLLNLAHLNNFAWQGLKARVILEVNE